MSTSNVRVLVYDSAHVPAKVIDAAGREAARIFLAAGIRLVWVSCTGRGEPAECALGPLHGQLSLHVVPKGKTSTESVYGEAYLGTDGVGTYGDVFFDRVEQAHRQFGVDEAQLLGAVAAHELGHLLLGFHAHAWKGIMAPVWEGESFRTLRMGQLLFTREQALQMRKRRENRASRVAGLEQK